MRNHTAQLSDTVVLWTKIAAPGIDAVRLIHYYGKEPLPPTSLSPEVSNTIGTKNDLWRKKNSSIPSLTQAV
jgi:hypothetical protein